jgi:hypothetical protein
VELDDPGAQNFFSSSAEPNGITRKHPSDWGDNCAFAKIQAAISRNKSSDLNAPATPANAR